MPIFVKHHTPCTDCDLDDRQPHPSALTRASAPKARAAKTLAATQSLTSREDLGLITVADFGRVDLRIARVVNAEYLGGADKHLNRSLDLGEGRIRTVFSGIRHTYPPEPLVDRLVVCVAKLTPRKMRFGVSGGMTLAASDGTGLFLANMDAEAQPGMKIR